MAAKQLKIDQLRLDLLNPRIGKADDQIEAMQAIIDEQGGKIANLAESIVDAASLNPMDRLLVLKEPDGKYTVLEGNRRTLALKLLSNPAAMTGLSMPSSVQRRIEDYATRFDKSAVEPIDCFETASRDDAATWIKQRHDGEDEGRGIVRWSSEASNRFGRRDPALQALDFVRQHGGLTEEEQKALKTKFPLSTLDRLLSSPDVRSQLGFEIVDNKLQTSLPPEEAIKPLKRMALDLTVGRDGKKFTVTDLKLVKQMKDYVAGIDATDKPDLSRSLPKSKAVQDISASDFSKKPKKPKVKKDVKRDFVVPSHCPLTVTGNRILEIYIELKSLKLKSHRNAIAVLLRVFSELSVDHYLSANGVPLKITKSGKHHYKSLATKVKETIEHMEAAGADPDDFKAVRRALTDVNHPLSIDLQNAYVHNRYLTPSESDLVLAWDNAQALFEKIWK